MSANTLRNCSDVNEDSAQSSGVIEEDTTKNTHNVASSLLEEDFPSGTILDIPCGHGAFTKRLLDKGYSVRAADCQDILQVPGQPLLKADMNQPLPLGDAELDAVICIDGIEHIERPFDFIAESWRVLKPGGVIIVSTPNISALRSRWRWLLTGFHNKCNSPLNETEPNPWHHINMLSFHKLRYILHREGFEVSKIATNRTKAISWLYFPLVLPAYLMTKFVFNKEEKDQGQRERNKEILKQMFSQPVLFGETLIVKAKKK